MGAPGYPPSSPYGGQYPPQHRPPGPDGYPAPGAPNYNSYSGQGPPPRWGPPGQYDQNTGPPNASSEMYNRGWNGAGYPPRSGFPGAPPVSTSAGGATPSQTNSFPSGQQYRDQYQVRQRREGFRSFCVPCFTFLCEFELFYYY